MRAMGGCAAVVVIVGWEQRRVQGRVDDVPLWMCWRCPQGAIRRQRQQQRKEGKGY